MLSARPAKKAPLASPFSWVLSVRLCLLFLFLFKCLWVCFSLCFGMLFCCVKACRRLERETKAKPTISSCVLREGLFRCWYFRAKGHKLCSTVSKGETVRCWMSQAREPSERPNGRLGKHLTETPIDHQRRRKRRTKENVNQPRGAERNNMEQKERTTHGIIHQEKLK